MGSSGFKFDGAQVIANQIQSGQVQISDDTITNILDSGILNINSRGQVNSLNITTLGSGYTSRPAITIDPPGQGVQATAVAHMGAVVAAPYNRGQDYLPGDVLTVVGGVSTTPTRLTVDTVRIKAFSNQTDSTKPDYYPGINDNNRGVGYKPNDTLTVTGGTGPAPATIIVTRVRLINPQIVSHGVGYTSGDKITVFGGSGTYSTTATIKADPITLQPITITGDGTTKQFKLPQLLTDAQIPELYVTINGVQKFVKSYVTIDGLLQLSDNDFTVTTFTPASGPTVSVVNFVVAPANGTTVKAVMGGRVTDIVIDEYDNTGTVTLGPGSYREVPNLLANPAVGGSGVGLVVEYLTAVDTVQIQAQGPYYTLPSMSNNKATGGSGFGAYFDLKTEINTVAISNPGDYSFLPFVLNNEATGGSGQGATINLSYGVRRAEVTQAGSLYTQTPRVTVDASPSGNTARISAEMTGARVNIGDLVVTGSARGTAPVTTNVLWVTVDGDDANDGLAQDRAKRTIKAACAVAEAFTTIFVKSGNYAEDNPIYVPERVSIIGDNLRRVNLYYRNPTRDFFWVNNACYIAGVSFRGGLAPGFSISFPPQGAGRITTSPYVQNCTAFNATGGGMKVDGNLAKGLKSMVLDAFTQFNQGGPGIYVTNQGYSQLVSIFTICCEIGKHIENGGTCSVNNSNTSFGDIGFLADGVSPYLFGGTVKPGTGLNRTDTLNIQKIAQRPYVALVATIGPEFSYVNTIDISDQGIGYTSAPSVLFEPALGYAARQAQATAVPNGSGGIASIAVDDGGDGYTGKASVTIYDISGTGALIGSVKYTALDTDGNPVILSGGRGYQAGDIISISGGSFPQYDNPTPLKLSVTSVENSVVRAVSIFDHGTYTDLPSKVSGGPTTSTGIGTGFSCSIRFGIKEIDVVNAGQGYTAPQIYISGPGGVTAKGTVSYDRQTGTITDVNLISQGGGYVSQPVVNIRYGGGTNSVDTDATAITEVNDGVVTKVRITNPGSNFVLDPEVTFSGGNGAGARAGQIWYQAVGVDVLKLVTEGTGVELVNGGSGYQINDILEIVGGTAYVDPITNIVTTTRVMVTGVTGPGTVTSVEIDRSGKYSAMPPVNGAETRADLTSINPTQGAGCLISLSMGLESIDLLSGGNSYVPGPRIRFIGGGATSKSFRAGQDYCNGIIQLIDSNAVSSTNALIYARELARKVISNTPISWPVAGQPGPLQTDVLYVPVVQHCLLHLMIARQCPVKQLAHTLIMSIDLSPTVQLSLTTTTHQISCS